MKNVSPDKLTNKSIRIGLQREPNFRVWQEENRDVIAVARDFVARHGLWSDGLRRF